MPLKSSNSTEVKKGASVLLGAAIGAILGLVAYVTIGWNKDFNGVNYLMI